MSIRVEYSTEFNQPFALVQIGEHLKLFKNPGMTARMPYWLQEQLINAALRQAEMPQRPAALPIEPSAQVIDLVSLRTLREARACARTVRST